MTKKPEPKPIELTNHEKTLLRRLIKAARREQEKQEQAEDKKFIKRIVE